MRVIKFLLYVPLAAVGVTAALWSNIPLIFVFSCLLLMIFIKRVTLRYGALLVSALAIPFVLDAAHHQMAAWDKQIRAEGPSSLSIWDSLAIYTGNFWMAAGGLCVGAPEAAYETLMLSIPNNNGRREANWVFFENDPSVLSALRMLAVEIEAKQAPRAQRKIRWPQEVYSLSNFRVALALAGGSVVVERDVASEKIVSYIDVPITYPANSYLTLLDYPFVKLAIPERIFWALEQKGWFHPYTMRYHFKFTMSDSGILIDDAS